MTKKVLGRGLGAFFPEYDPASQSAPAPAAKAPSDSKDTAKGAKEQAAATKPAAPRLDPEQMVNVVLEIPVEDIRPNPHQPRLEFDEEALQELADSILEHGLIQPVTVRYIGERRFELISGERRLRASRLAGLATLPAYIREADDEQIIALALVENIQREQLNPMEMAMGYQRLIEECRYTQAQVAEKIGKNRTTITNTLRLLQLPAALQSALKRDQITTGHARALINLKDGKLQETLLARILRDELSVRQVEDLVRDLEKRNPIKKPDPSATRLPAHLTEFRSRLRQALSTRVEVTPKGDGGEIRIQYFSDEDLERIMGVLEGNGDGE